MPQPYTLVARPVILSENKTSVISHGRPLSPIGTARSSRPFFIPQIKGSFTEEKHGDTLSFPKEPPNLAPSITLLDYQKSANNNLMTINNNLSMMLKESFAGIDSICKQVRLCLLEANTNNAQKANSENTAENRTFVHSDSFISHKLKTVTPKNLETRNSESLDTNRADNRAEPFRMLSIYEDEESNASIDEVLDIPEEANDSTAEIIEEDDEDDEEEKNEDDKEEENEDEKEEENEDGHKRNYKSRKNIRTPSLTPFFTMINPTDQSAESIGVNIINSLTSKIGISRKCTIESFQKSMKKVEKLADYEHFLTNMVEGINKEIDDCYAEFPRMLEAVNDSDEPYNFNKKGDGKKSTKPSIIYTRSQTPELAKTNREPTEDDFENDLSYKMTNEKRKRFNMCRMDFTHPDVYRKRAITDLHRRLEAQVEANDSLIFFQKLMKKTRKHMSNDRPATAMCSNSDKPTNGNTFKTSWQHNPKAPIQCLLHPKCNLETKKERSLSELSKIYQDSLWFKQKKQEVKRNKKDSPSLRKRRDRNGKKGKKKLTRSCTKVENYTSESAKINKIIVKTPPPDCACNCKIKITNNQPMTEAQKCKLHWMRAKYSQLRNRKLKYLDILDDVTNKDLVPIKAEYPRRDEITSTRLKDTYLYKLMYEEDKNTLNAWDQLFKPTIKCSQDDCGKCSMTNIAGQEDPTQEKQLRADTICMDVGTNSNMGRGDIIRKLSKYIFVDEAIPGTPKHVFTVMPVHVFYDQSKIPSGPKRTQEIPQKLPLVPMRETTIVKKAEWNDAGKKKPLKVVYDPALKKLEKEIRAVNEKKPGNLRHGQTNSWSPKNFSQYCSPHQPTEPRTFMVKINTIDKTQAKQKSPASSNSRNTPPIAELFKRSTKSSTEKDRTPLVVPLWHSSTANSNKHQKDMDVKQKIQKVVSSEGTARTKSEQQRKIWENKYGKSVGQKLLNYIEKQPVPYETPVPKYALPKSVNNPLRHQAMLEQLRSLKQKNDNIQTNIQKAINVIENKMVDILSKPTTSDSIQAFDEMEKQITNVLSLMKGPVAQKVKKENIKNSEDDYGMDISDELFHRLDRILESPGMSSSGKSSKNALTKEEKAKRKKKTPLSMPLKSTDMNQVCFSSTSATGEEKFTITAISPKRPVKGHTRAPYIKGPTDTRHASADDISVISNDIRKLENQLNFEQITKDDQREESHATDEPPESIREETLPKRSSKSGHRNRIPEQDQIVNVNIALVSSTAPEGSAGDQLQELKRLLENELKSIDVSESIGVSSQGDFEVPNAIKEGDEAKNSKDKMSESTERDFDSVFNDKEEASVAQTEIRESKRKPAVFSYLFKPDATSPEKADTRVPPEFHNHKSDDDETKKRLPKLIHDIRTIEEVTEKEQSDPVAQEAPPKIPANGKQTVISQQGESQVSLDVTGPYFTPQTSPLDKTRGQKDEEQQQRCTTIKEEQKICHTEESGVAKETLNQDDDAGDNTDRSSKEEDRHQKSIEDLPTEDKDEISSKQESHKEDKKKDGLLFDEERTEEIDEFYENVNKIISRVENVYSQLEEFEEEMLLEERNLVSDPLTSRSPLLEGAEDDDPLLELPDLETDLFLSPFMDAVKDLRKHIVYDKLPDSRKSTPRGVVLRSSSLYNVLSFLDTLADIKEERPLDVYMPRICYTSYVVQIPQTFHQATIQHQSSVIPIPTVPKELCYHHPAALERKTSHTLRFLEPTTFSMPSSPYLDGKISSTFPAHILEKDISSTPLLPTLDEETSSTPQSANLEEDVLQRKFSIPLALDKVISALPLPSVLEKETSLPTVWDEPKKKAGCLKTSISKLNTVSSKSKQKVSFLLQKEEKSTQVTSCPLHSLARMLSQQKLSTTSESLSLTSNTTKRDEQVSAYLDACENKSVDKMSLNDDETYQSTFEFSDEISERNLQMPEQLIQNLQETLQKKSKNVVEIFRSSNSEDNRPVKVNVFSDKHNSGDGKSVCEEKEREKLKGVEEANKKLPVKVFYDNFQSGQDKIDLSLICGFYNEDSILQVKNSIAKNLSVRKRESLEKIVKNINELTLSAEILRETSLLEPLKNLHQFIDSKLLKEAVEKRQALRMMRRKSSHSFTLTSKRDTNTSTDTLTKEPGEKKNLLKGFYAFVYLLVFTALNLEYKCVQ